MNAAGFWQSEDIVTTGGSMRYDEQYEDTLRNAPWQNMHQQSCQPKMAKYRRFQQSKNKTPLYCLEIKTHFTAFLSVHFCSPNTVSQFFVGLPHKDSNYVA